MAIQSIACFPSPPRLDPSSGAGGSDSASEWTGAQVLSQAVTGLLPETVTEDLLDRWHGRLDRLLWADSDELQKVPGIGPVKACALLAAVELSRRMLLSRLEGVDLSDWPERVVPWLYARFGRLDQEVMGAVFLDAKNHLLSAQVMFAGTLTRAAVEPRQILRRALAVGARGFLLFHTHPTGSPAPSQEDLSFTARVERAAEVVGLRLLDHLVIGDRGHWESLNRRRLG